MPDNRATTTVRLPGGKDSVLAATIRNTLDAMIEASKEALAAVRTAAPPITEPHGHKP